MDRTNFVLQKITDLLIWDDMTGSQLIFTLDRKDSVISLRKTGQKVEGVQTAIIVENRCGQAGLPEIVKIISGLNWNEIVSFIFITKDMSQVKKIQRLITSLVYGQGDIYGIDPDYYFSLVPIDGFNHKKIEKFVMSLKNQYATKDKIKYFVKKMMVSLNWSKLLYEQYVFCFYCINR